MNTDQTLRSTQRQIEQGRDGNATDDEDFFQSSISSTALMGVGNVEDVVSHERDIGRLAVHDFPQVDGNFVFRGGAGFRPVDIGFIGGVRGETLGEGQHFEDGSPGRILHGEGARHFDVADDVDFADLGNADLFAAFQDEVGGRVGGFDQGFCLDAADQGGGASGWCTGGGRRQGSGYQDLGAGFGGQPPGAG